MGSFKESITLCFNLYMAKNGNLRGGLKLLAVVAMILVINYKLGNIVYQLLIEFNIDSALKVFVYLFKGKCGGYSTPFM